MDDKEFLNQFENCTLAKQYFNHKSHIRIAWLYLSKYELNEVISKITQGIQRYATSIGAAQIYHETLTLAWVYLVYHSMQDDKSINFEDFIEKHQQLLDKDLPLQYYSSTLLNSDLARKQWIAPDLKSF